MPTGCSRHGGGRHHGRQQGVGRSCLLGLLELALEGDLLAEQRVPEGNVGRFGVVGRAPEGDLGVEGGDLLLEGLDLSLDLSGRSERLVLGQRSAIGDVGRGPGVRLAGRQRRRRRRGTDLDDATQPRLARRDRAGIIDVLCDDCRTALLSRMPISVAMTVGSTAPELGAWVRTAAVAWYWR